jgi:hypothetical protein
MSKRDRKSFLMGDVNDTGTPLDVVAGTQHNPLKSPGPRALGYEK